MSIVINKLSKCRIVDTHKKSHLCNDGSLSLLLEMRLFGNKCHVTGPTSIHKLS